MDDNNKYKYSKDMRDSINYIMDFCKENNGDFNKNQITKKIWPPDEGEQEGFFKRFKMDKPLKILTGIGLLEYTGPDLNKRGIILPSHESYELLEKGFTFTTIEDYFDDLEAERELKKLTVHLTKNNIKNLENILSYYWLTLFGVFLTSIASMFLITYYYLKFKGLID